MRKVWQRIIPPLFATYVQDLSSLFFEAFIKEKEGKIIAGYAGNTPVFIHSFSKRDIDKAEAGQ